MTDGRGVIKTYTYENVSGVPKRPLVTGINWTVGTTGVITTGVPIGFTYDNLGNRTQMTDSQGTQNYTYDSLSRMTSETRAFTSGFGTYSLEYTYTLGGQVKTYGFPSEASRTVTYAHDKAGRVTGVTGGGFGGVSNYLTGIGYRAFDSPKNGTYGSGKTLTQTYDSRLNISNYTVSGTANTSYGYDNDGSIKSVTDNLDGRFDRLYRSDHAGRLKIAYTGLEARDEAQTSIDRPFRQTYTYDAFSHLTERTLKNWALTPGPVGDTFVNNRKLAGEYSYNYDNDGREIYANRSQFERVATTFDAAGNRLSVVEEDYDTQYSLWISRWIINQSYDGDGQRLVQQEQGASWPTLLLRSSVMGGTVLAEANSINSVWYKDLLIYAGGEIVAQQKDNYQIADEVKFMYTNPITGAQRGAVQSEPDPLGTDQGLSQQQGNPPIYSGDSGIMDPGRYADAFNGRFCTDTGAIMPCEAISDLLSRGQGSVETGLRIFNSRLSGYRTAWQHRWQTGSGSRTEYLSPNTESDYLRGLLAEGGSLSPIYDLSIDLRIDSFFNIVASGAGKTLRFKDKDAFRKHFDTVVNSGDCKKKLNQLLAEIGRLGVSGQELAATDIVSLFKNVDSQTKGGFEIDKTDGQAFEQYKTLNSLSDQQARELWPAGGGGMTFRNHANQGERYVYNYGGDGWLADTYNVPKQIQRFAYKSFQTTVHEMFHAAGKTNSFRHSQMDEAAVNLGAHSFTDFVRKACIPEKYW